MRRFLTEDDNTKGKYKMPKVIRHRLRKEWDDVDAEYSYVLYRTTRFWGHSLKEVKTGLFKKITVRTNVDSFDMTSAIAQGDKKWAQKIAKKYNIRMPK